MRVVVVGGTGNVGSGVVAALAARRHDVVVLSRRPSPEPMSAGVRHVPVDRADRAAYERLLGDVAGDAVVDLVAFGADDAVSTVRGATGARHVVLCSSVSVYGREATTTPLTEDAPIRPAGGYGRGKAEAEEAFRHERGREGRGGIVLRPGVVYGRNVLRRQLGADPAFVSRLRRRVPVLVSSGAGSARFQPILSRDLGEAVAVCLAAGVTGTYNVVGPEVMTWEQHHRSLAEVLGLPPAEVVEVPAGLLGDDRPAWVRGYESRSSDRLYDAGRLARRTGFAPETRWETGAAGAVAWMTARGLVAPSRPGDWEDRILRGLELVRGLPDGQ